MKSISEIITRGLTPSFSNVSIRLFSGVSNEEWKSEGVENRFYICIAKAFREAGWLVSKPYGEFCLVDVSKDGQVLHVHPVFVNGYIREENLDSVIGIFKCVNGVSVVSADTDVGVYNLTDATLFSLFYAHRAEIEDSLIEAFSSPCNKNRLFDMVDMDERISRLNTPSAIPFDETVEFLAVNEFFEDLIATGRIKVVARDFTGKPVMFQAA